MDQDLADGAPDDRTGSGEGGYLREVWNELRKTVWPTWPELRQMTGVVIVTVVLLGAFLGLLDYGFTVALKPLYTSQPAATTTPTPTPAVSPTPTPTPSASGSPNASPSP
ncbi:MAG: preprotein translocase subunit SecE [Candidatus Dormibacteria bacterium]